MNKVSNFFNANKKSITIFIAILLIVAIVCLCAIKLDDWLLTRYSTMNNPDIYDDMRTVIINDTEYLPKNISTYLLIGIDKDEKIETFVDGKEQADFIMCIICNHDNKTVTALQINRDTLVNVKMLDSNTNKVRYEREWQINLSHTYGSDESARALNTLDSFTDLMNNLPVTNYLSFSMPLVKNIMGTIGSVSVTITEEAADPSIGYNKDDVVTITTGDEALDFVRERTSNIGRMARQKLFMDEVYKKFQSKSIDYDKIIDAVDDYMYTNITDGEFENLYNYIKDYTFSGIMTLAGTDGTRDVGSETWATFTVSDETVNEFLINYCYDVR